MYDGKTVIAGAMIRDRWADSGSSSHGYITCDVPECADTRKIAEFLEKIDYYGLFSFEYGMIGDKAYILNLRITKAKQMLRFTDKKLEDIGYQCGLGAPHYFSRIFKQVEGITPSEFREKW